MYFVLVKMAGNQERRHGQFIEIFWKTTTAHIRSQSDLNILTVNSVNAAACHLLLLVDGCVQRNSRPPMCDRGHRPKPP